jgi:hypothetical protein
MPLSADQRIRLLNAIETNTLVFLCGAGLSMATPSNLPSAVRVANLCYDRRIAIEPMDIPLREDIDRLAGLFHNRGDFERVFIPLVPWDEMLGSPNAGHAAVSDLLVCRAAHAAMSTNFDRMIESWAQSLKVDLRGALNGQEATSFCAITNPLLKFHGCMDRNRDHTLWTQGQLLEPETQTRLQSCSQWMNLHLPGKHLVVVGFWSDWKYLNQVLSDAFTIDTASAVTVIDPSPTVSLQAKAPELWSKLTGLSHQFEHVQGSGATVLDELRLEYSRTWTRRFYSLGEAFLNPAAGVIAAGPVALAAAAAVPHNPNGLDVDALYDLRRDAEGVPYSKAAILRTPPTHSAQASSMRLLLLDGGATELNSWLRYNGTTVRIVNGAGQSLESVQSRYIEPASVPKADLVVCAGAMRTGVPATIIPKGRGLSVVRPSAAAGSRWVTLEESRAELLI